MKLFCPYPSKCLTTLTLSHLRPNEQLPYSKPNNNPKQLTGPQYDDSVHVCALRTAKQSKQQKNM